MQTQILIQGQEIRTVNDFHRIMKRELELPDYYGNNLDALWDCLTGWIDTPVTLIWFDFEESKQALGTFADKIVALFSDAEKKIEGFKIEYK